MDIPVSSPENSGLDNWSGSKLLGLEHLDDVVFLTENPSKFQASLDCLDGSVCAG